MHYAQPRQVAKRRLRRRDGFGIQGRLSAGEESRRRETRIAHPGNFIPCTPVLLRKLLQQVLRRLVHDVLPASGIGSHSS
jgi:hypothetical protein